MYCGMVHKLSPHGQKKPDSKCRSSSCRNERNVIWTSGDITFYSIYISFTLFLFCLSFPPISSSLVLFYFVLHGLKFFWSLFPLSRYPWGALNSLFLALNSLRPGSCPKTTAKSQNHPCKPCPYLDRPSRARVKTKAGHGLSSLPETPEQWYKAAKDHGLSNRTLAQLCHSGKFLF